MSGVARIALLSAFVAFSPLALAGEGAGPPIKYAANLSADEETSAVESPGKGRAEFSLDRETLKLTWHVTFEGLTGPATAAHVHGPQVVGVDAPVEFPIGGSGAVTSPIDGSVVLTEDQLDHLVSARMYVNVHTAKNPKGEIRGQLRRVPPGG